MLAGATTYVSAATAGQAKPTIMAAIDSVLVSMVPACEAVVEWRAHAATPWIPIRFRSLTFLKATPGGPCDLACRFRVASRRRLAVDAVEGYEQRARLGAGDAIPDRLASAAGGNETILAQEGQMLRDAGIADAEELGQLADRSFTLDELAQDEQAMPVGKRLQQPAGAVCRTFHEVGFKFHTCTYTQV